MDALHLHVAFVRIKGRTLAHTLLWVNSQLVLHRYLLLMEASTLC